MLQTGSARGGICLQLQCQVGVLAFVDFFLWKRKGKGAEKRRKGAKGGRGGRRKGAKEERKRKRGGEGAKKGAKRRERSEKGEKGDAKERKKGEERRNKVFESDTLPRWHQNWRGFGVPPYDLPLTNALLRFSFDLKLPPYFEEKDFPHIANIILHSLDYAKLQKAANHS